MKTPVLSLEFRSSDAWEDDDINFDSMELTLSDDELDSIKAAINFMDKTPKVPAVYVSVDRIRFFCEDLDNKICKEVSTDYYFNLSDVKVFKSGNCYLCLQHKHNASNTIEFYGFTINDLIPE